MRKMTNIGAYLKLKTNEMKNLINNRVITIEASTIVNGVSNVVCLDLRPIPHQVQYITNIKATYVNIQSKYAIRIELTPQSFISAKSKPNFTFVENKLLTINLNINNEELLFAQVLPYTKIAKDLKRMLKPTETTAKTQVKTTTETTQEVVKAIVIKASNAKELEQDGMTFISKDNLKQYHETGLLDECNAQVKNLTAHYVGLNFRMEFKNCILYWVDQYMTTMVLEQLTNDTTKERIIK